MLEFLVKMLLESAGLPTVDEGDELFQCNRASATFKLVENAARPLTRLVGQVACVWAQAQYDVSRFRVVIVVLDGRYACDEQRLAALVIFP